MIALTVQLILKQIRYRNSTRDVKFFVADPVLKTRYVGVSSSSCVWG